MSFGTPHFFLGQGRFVCLAVSKQSETDRPSFSYQESHIGFEGPTCQGKEGYHPSFENPSVMEVPLAASAQDKGDEWVSSGPGESLDSSVDQSSIKDEAGTGALSEQTHTQEFEDPAREQVQSQDQEEKVVEEGITLSRLDRDAPKKEAKPGKAELQTVKGKIDSETDSTLVQRDEERKKEKEPEFGEAELQMKDRAERKVKSEKERKGKDVLVGREDDKVEGKRKIGETKVDAKQGENQIQIESSPKNVEKGEQGKKEKREKSEKKLNNSSGQPEGDKKKDKKDKKSKSSVERIQKKLEKINAKIVRILAKKEDYELRLREAQERERQGSEKAALQETEALAALTKKPALQDYFPDLRREVADGFRLDDDSSTKELGNGSAERGLSGSLSRTASVIEGTPAELMEEVAGQKKVVEKLATLLVTDGSGVNAPLPMEDPDLAMKGNGECLKHILQVDDLKDTETL